MRKCVKVVYAKSVKFLGKDNKTSMCQPSKYIVRYTGDIYERFARKTKWNNYIRNVNIGKHDTRLTHTHPSTSFHSDHYRKTLKPEKFRIMCMVRELYHHVKHSSGVRKASLDDDDDGFSFFSSLLLLFSVCMCGVSKVHVVLLLSN